jgi:hypothetical protein
MTFLFSFQNFVISAYHHAPEDSLAFPFAGTGMLLAENLFVDLNGPPVERLGLGIPA